MERKKILFFKNIFKKNENIKINKNNIIEQKRKKNLYKIVNKKYEKKISILKIIFLIFLCFIYILISPKKIILIILAYFLLLRIFQKSSEQIKKELVL